MRTARRAVIDIGTNSVKLLVADVAGRDVRPALERSRQTRLGRGFYQTHRLQPDAVAQTAEAVAAFATTACGLGATSVRVIATSAGRDAKNPELLLGAVKRAAGLQVEIISGEQEADWAFQGVTTDPNLARQPLLLLDVGGGSTEFILGQGQHQQFRGSYPLGTVRLLEKRPPRDPPAAGELADCRRWLREFLCQEVRPKLASWLHQAPASATVATTGHGDAPDQVGLVGTGGTATILGRLALKMDSFERERIEATRLNLAEVQATVARLWSLPLTGRKQVPGLPPNRADVILFGVVIYEAVMEQFGFDELRLSTRGLRFAAVMEGV